MFPLGHYRVNDFYNITMILATPNRNLLNCNISSIIVYKLFLTSL